MRISTASCWCLLMLAAGTAAAQPTVPAGGVVNVASYTPVGLPGSGIAQGSIFTVFGSNLGPANITYASYPLPTQLAGTSIQVTVGGVTVNAIMIYSAAGQVAAILPSSTPVGNGTLTVTYNGQTSVPVSVQVVQSSFGIFARNQAGSGPAVVQNYKSPTEQPFNSLLAPAKPRQVEILWGTGLGPVSGDETRAPQGGNLPVDVKVFVGGKQANIFYKGRTPCCAGEDQINFEVPEGVEGCTVPVAVQAGGVVSNHTTMSISSSDTVCSDATGYSAADLKAAVNNGKFSAGSVVLSRTGVRFAAPTSAALDITSDNGSGSFFRYDASRLVNSLGNFGFVSLGGCLVFTFRGQNASITDPVRPDPLDAGPALTVAGPNGTKQLDLVTKGHYSATLGGGFPGLPGTLPPYLDKGQYTVTGPGGADVGQFTATINLPDPLVWTNQDSITTVLRSQDLPITWSGGDPNAFVFITGYSVSADNVGATFTCTERVSAGQFTVPSFVLSALPPSGSSEGVPLGGLLVGTTPLPGPNKFTAPGLDAAYFIYSMSFLKSAGFE